MVLSRENDNLLIIQQYPSTGIRFFLGIGFIGFSIYMMFRLKVEIYVLLIFIFLLSILIAFLQRVHVINRKEASITTVYGFGIPYKGLVIRMPIVHQRYQVAGFDRVNIIHHEDAEGYAYYDVKIFCSDNQIIGLSTYNSSEVALRTYDRISKFINN